MNLDSMYYINLYEQTHDISLIPVGFLTQDMCNDYYYNHGGDIRYIPKRFLTREICNDYYKRTGNVKYIPEGFLTQKMCDDYYARTGKLYGIPVSFITQKMCDDYYARTGDIMYMPVKFVTQEMMINYFGGYENCLYISDDNYRADSLTIIDYCIEDRSVEYIPEELRTEELFTDYCVRTFGISYIPDEFMTQELCTAYNRMTGEIYGIPIQFLTQEMCNNHYNFKKKFDTVLEILDFIPIQFRTQEMYIELYAEIKPKNIRYIPERFRTQEMCDDYYARTGDFMHISKKFWTQKIADDYYAQTKDAINIPEKFMTQEMWETYYRQTKKFEHIPAEFLTQEMCNDYYELTGDFEFIPERFWTQDMYDDYYMQQHDVSNIPEEFITDTIIQDFLKKSTSFWELPVQVKKKIIKDLINIIMNNGTIQDISTKYNVTSKFVEQILRYIEKTDIEIYDKIKKQLENNNSNYISNCMKEAEVIENILASLGPIVNGILSHEQKIIFSYKLKTSNITCPIHEIYNCVNLAHATQQYPNFIKFCKIQLRYIYSEMLGNQKILLYDREEYMLEHSDDWLNLFSLEEEFFDKAGNRISRMFKLTDGSLFEITPEIVKIVLNYLQENNIPLVNCIVNEAIRCYAFGGLDSFIQKLTAGNDPEHQKVLSRPV